MEKRYKEIDGVKYQVIQNTILGSNVIPVGESLPEVTTSDSGKLLGVDSSGEWVPVDAPSDIPDITGNAGKVLKVNAGATGTEWANETTELPAVTAADEGDVLTVNASGEWEAAAPGGGGGNFLKVNAAVSNGKLTLDKTYLEIKQAHSSGSVVIDFTSPVLGTMLYSVLTTADGNDSNNVPYSVFYFDPMSETISHFDAEIESDYPSKTNGPS